MEEEKGNLQLRLVDFEDMTGNNLSFAYTLKFIIYVTKTIILQFQICFSFTASDENLKEELKESQTKLQRKEDELDEHVRALSKLETEKLDLVEGRNIKLYP